jgi:hypothetical protein
VGAVVMPRTDGTDTTTHGRRVTEWSVANPALRRPKMACERLTRLLRRLGGQQVHPRPFCRRHVRPGERGQLTHPLPCDGRRLCQDGLAYVGAKRLSKGIYRLSKSAIAEHS